jgi:hypothetical protein
MQVMIDVQEITYLQSSTVHMWHKEEISNPYSGLLATVCEQHGFNFRLWHEEDIARSPSADDSQIAAVKRNIDKLNQQRNDFIEKIDDGITALISQRNITTAAEAPINTETPGSVIDRLSIMALRIYHLNEQMARTDVTDAHLFSVQRKLAVCMVQHHELSEALQQLLDNIGRGLIRHRTYRQCKMYNDPALNPYLYSPDGKSPDDKKKAA